MTSGGRKHGNRAAEIAHRYRPQAVAALVAILRDERTPAAARTAAASRLLELSREAEPVKVVDLDALDPDELEALFVKLLAHMDVTPKGFAKEIRALRRVAQREAAREHRQRRKPLPHRQPSSLPQLPSAAPGASEGAAPAMDAQREEHASLTQGSAAEAAFDITPHAAAPAPALVAGPDQAIVDVPHRINVDVGNRVHLLRPGRQVVPRDVAEHPVIKRFVIEEEPPHAA